MIQYNVTIKIEKNVAEEWRAYMLTEHIPDVMKTNFFTSYKMCQLLDQDDSDGPTYVIQYFAETIEQFNRYNVECAEALQKEHATKFPNKFVAFRSMLQEIEA